MVAKATSARSAGPARPAAPVPTDPVELLSTPLAQSGLSAGPTLRRAGIKLDFYTVRDLLFHLPRRYDDLREMRSLGDLVWEPDGNVISARARVADVRVEPGFRNRTQRTIARLEDRTGSIDATWFGRRFIERRLRIGGEVVVSGKVKHFGRKLTLDNPEFQVVTDDTEVLHAGRIVPVYPLTAGLTSARLRAAIREALDRAGHAYPEYLPAEIRDEEGLIGIDKSLLVSVLCLVGPSQFQVPCVTEKRISHKTPRNGYFGEVVLNSDRHGCRPVVPGKEFAVAHQPIDPVCVRIAAVVTHLAPDI